MNGIDARMTDLLERVLDVASKRETLIASNVANIDTPGYQTKDIDFHEAMLEADAGIAKRSVGLEATAPGHLGAKSHVDLGSFEYEPGDLPRRNDLNNVSIDREMLEMSKTSGKYNVTIELLKKRFALIKYAITGGGNAQ